MGLISWLFSSSEDQYDGEEEIEIVNLCCNSKPKIYCDHRGTWIIECKNCGNIARSLNYNTAIKRFNAM